MPEGDRTESRVVGLEINGPVAVVTLQRPPINALDEAALCGFLFHRSLGR